MTYTELVHPRRLRARCTRIRYAQGVYFAKPLFLEDFTTARRVDLKSRAVELARGQPESRGLRSSRMAPAARSEFTA